MHDPMIQAFDIKYPWWEHRPWPKRFRFDDNKFDRNRHWKDIDQRGRSEMWPEGYRETFITIWHVDPEKDGSDDSCGWSYPKLTKRQKKILRNASWSENRNPIYLCHKEKKWTGSLVKAEQLHRGLALLVCRVLRIKMSWDHVCRYAAERTLVDDTLGDPGSPFCFLPGYHTNSDKDTPEIREDHFYCILCNVARNLLDQVRPWWKHPRWHFWHWKIQVRPLMGLKRMLFSRCCKCGGRFKYSESVISNQWHGTGPRWFRGEQAIMHESCSGVSVACEAKPCPTSAQ